VTTKTTAPTDALALITLARTGDTAELLKLALDHLDPKDGETLREALVREAALISVLARLAGLLVDCYDDLAPGRVDAILQRTALKWAAEADGGES
jgi:hypothetical protein